MVALPALKFVFLGVRQLTRPVVRRIVTRATTKKGPTRQACIVLGRLSLGLSGVIAEWSRKEDLKLVELKRKEAEEKREKAAVAAAVAAQKETDPAASTKSHSESTATPTAATGSKGATAAPSAPVASITAETKRLMKEALGVAEGKDAIHEKEAAEKAAAAGVVEVVKPQVAPAIATPRSRSLLNPLTYGPAPKEADSGYDETIFLDPKRTAGEVARVFIRYPYRSVWTVFRKTFLAPFPEQKLIDAGAELLIELLAFFILAVILAFELRQQSKVTAAKEAHLEARLTAIESTVNELVRHSKNAGAPGLHGLRELTVPKLVVPGRLYGMWLDLVSGYDAIGQLLTSAPGPNGSMDPKGENRTRNGEGGGSFSSLASPPPGPIATATPVGVSGSPPKKKAPAPTSVKVSKHDETAMMKQELDRLLALSEEPRKTA